MKEVEDKAAAVPESQAPCKAWPTRAALTMFFLSLLHTVFVCVLLSDLTAPAVGRVWVGFVRPISEVVGLLISSVNGISDDLVRRGFNDRAMLVHVALGVQWLLGFLGAICLLLPAFFRGCLRNAKNNLVNSKNFSGLKFLVTIMFGVGLFIYGIVRAASCESSIISGRGSVRYDLGVGFGGLIYTWVLISLCLFMVSGCIFMLLAFLLPRDAKVNS